MEDGYTIALVRKDGKPWIEIIATDGSPIADVFAPVAGIPVAGCLLTQDQLEDVARCVPGNGFRLSIDESGDFRLQIVALGTDAFVTQMDIPHYPKTIQ